MPTSSGETLAIGESAALEVAVQRVVETLRAKQAEVQSFARDLRDACSL